MVEMHQLMKLVESKDETSWRAALFDVAHSLGFDSVMCAAVPSRHAGVDSSFVHSNYSLEWRKHYLSAKLYEIDPTVTHCRQSHLPLVWQPETFSQHRQIEMYEEASGFGIRAGVTFPMHGMNGEAGLVSFATDALPGEKFTDRLVHFMADLSLVRDYAFESALPFIHGRTATEPLPHLTKRELEVLKWVMAGKSSWEISRITDCAEATVNFHISNIRQKFNVNTRQQALVKAIALGIITPEDPHR